MISFLEILFRKYFPKRIENHKILISKFRGKNGLEIGGPSNIFTKKGFLPIYPVVNNLDGCNFSANTVWEGSIAEGKTYTYGDKIGHQFISDGNNLSMISDEKYDFILSCHSLEHFANPIKAINEWKRVLKNDGFILLILPHKDKTFDHRRQVTSLEHIISDFTNNTLESDTTHVEEVLKFHDLTLDPAKIDLANLTSRTADNYNNRCLHHHVFNTPLVVKIGDYLNFKICEVSHFNPFHIVVLLQKTNTNFDNAQYKDPNNSIYQKPSFPSDKLM